MAPAQPSQAQTRESACSLRARERRKRAGESRQGRCGACRLYVLKLVPCTVLFLSNKKKKQKKSTEQMILIVDCDPSAAPAHEQDLHTLVQERGARATPQPLVRSAWHALRTPAPEGGGRSATQAHAAKRQKVLCNFWGRPPPYPRPAGRWPPPSPAGAHEFAFLATMRGLAAKAARLRVAAPLPRGLTLHARGDLRARLDSGALASSWDRL